MGKKLNNNKSGRARQNKERKRKEAEARLVEYNSMSALQKIEVIKSRRGESKKEMNRLLSEIA